MTNFTTIQLFKPADTLPKRRYIFYTDQADDLCFLPPPNAWCYSESHPLVPSLIKRCPEAIKMEAMEIRGHPRQGRAALGCQTTVSGTG